MAAAFPVPADPRVPNFKALLALSGPDRSPFLSYLVPPELCAKYDLSTATPWVRDTTGAFRDVAVPGESALRIEVWPDPEAPDPALVLELSTTHLGQLEASWIVLNDLRGPRYHVDRSPEGAPIPIGTAVRNLREELRALSAGLAPNQVRPGLKLFRPLIERIEGLATSLGIGILYVAPLAYHNAIKYEHYGFTYSSGQEELTWVHREFQPGGVLRRRLDGSRPFRMPWMADTIRGRSWAIHDGILGRRWMAPQMYKFVGRGFSTRTFPNAHW